MAQQEFKFSDEVVRSLVISPSQIEKELISSTESRRSIKPRKGSLANKLFEDESLMTVSEKRKKDGQFLDSMNASENGFTSSVMNQFHVEHWVFSNMFQINLRHNCLSSDSMYFLGIILGNCSNLVTLDLSFNHLGKEGGIILFKNLIKIKGFGQ